MVLPGRRLLARFKSPIRTWLVAGTLASLAVSAAAALVPMWIGMAGCYVNRSFTRQEKLKKLKS